VRLRKFVHALALLVAVGLSAAAPTNAAQDNLIDASGAGDLSQVKALLGAKADVDAKTADGRTALMLASQNGHLGQRFRGSNHIKPLPRACRTMCG
jgi:ankyrin repeat protein